MRELSPADAGFVLQLLNDPAFVRYIGDRGVKNRADAHRYIAEGPVASYRTLGFGPYAVVLKDTGEVIGICGLLKREFLEDVDLGFALLPRFRSKGYAFEAAAAILEHARLTRGIRRVLAIVSPDNAASMTLLARLGFVFEREIAPSDAEPPVRLFVRSAAAAQ
jgi:RimJ/RimL family protein N-acetyltransferase